LHFSSEAIENPFDSEGELHKKADYIIRHSTISRTTIIIADPDAEQSELEDVDNVVERSIQVINSSELHSALPLSHQDEHISNGNGHHHGNGRDHSNVSVKPAPESIEVRVGKTVATRQEPLKAEKVVVKGKKKHCEIL
jgi:hypothetical protein